MSTLDIALAVIGSAVLLIGLLSDPLKRRWLSGPLLALVLGVLLGPHVTGVLDPARWGEVSTLLEEVARLTVAVSLMGIALRLPRGYLREHWRSLVIVLGPVMVLMWLVSGLLVFALLAVPIWVALLVGAVLTPTDPVVASTIVQGRLAQRLLPARLRHFLSAESGANDTLAYPLVFLALLMLEKPASSAVGEWLWRVVIAENVGAVLLGGALGYLVGRLMLWGYRRDTFAPTSHLLFSVALTVAVLGATHLTGANGLLAVFVAGLVFRGVIPEDEDRTEERVQEGVNDFFLLPVFVLLGLALPWERWADLGWRGPALVVAVLLLRRLPAFVALSPAMRTVRGRSEAFFLGWFGPIGVAALYYGTLSWHESGHALVWTVASLVISASVLVHGISATPFSRRLSQAGERAGARR
ncbi:cation:proton antiporter domain-containing protein [Saccharomonospora saliphila]|uniref:cation:proton antiporter domain-containing protein n=1 Tax=Saccharomonospora saliphila TaxID=369829 RepID=UPI0012FC3619|nr:cation:proton antiporter [Saccharomonospora saliphila]